MPTSPLAHVTARELAERYAALFLDAYGVLVTHDGVLPGAAELVARLHARRRPFWILTNDASHSPEHTAERYQGLGLAIAPDQIITSGLLLGRHFADHGLVGARCVVLGPNDSSDYVRRAGGVVADLAAGEPAEALIVCDERGFDLLPTLDRALSLLYRRLDAGQPVHLVVPNPDLVYPAREGSYGFTAGALSLLFEEALRWRYPERSDLRFVRLGKPYRAIYEEALRRSQTRDVVMIGDQLATDIRGAVGVGIDSALVPTGLTRLAAGGEPPGGFPPDARPTYVLDSLDW